MVEIETPRARRRLRREAKDAVGKEGGRTERRHASQELTPPDSAVHRAASSWAKTISMRQTCTSAAAMLSRRFPRVEDVSSAQRLAMHGATR
jgi:hypothetical protein